VTSDISHVTRGGLVLRFVFYLIDLE